jgi:hypothetical protein
MCRTEADSKLLFQFSRLQYSTKGDARDASECIFKHYDHWHCLIHDTIQYLQTVSALITASDNFTLEGWAALHLATQLQQHRYEEINATDATDHEDVIHCTPAQVRQQTRCTKCIAEQ